MPRKPKGWAYRYEIVRRLTTLNNGQSDYRWHVVKYYGQKRGAETYGYLNPCPGPNVEDERLISCAGSRARFSLTDVTVPVIIIRDPEER